MSERRSIGKQISTLSRSLSALVDARLAHLGLGASTVPVLGFLLENEDVHQDVLAEALQFDKSSAARAVARLVEMGYLTKITDPANRRRNIVGTTDKGRAHKQDIYRILRGLTDDLFVGFSQREIDRYFELTERIHGRVKRLLEETR